MASSPSNGRRRRLPARAATVAFAALCAPVLAGCNGSSDASGPGGAATTLPGSGGPVALPADRPQKPACGLITRAEVEAALGARVNPGRESTQEGRSLCGFSLASAADQSVLLVSTTSSGVPATYDAVQARADSPQAISAGDEAFVSGRQALVRRGDTMVAILVSMPQQPGQLAATATKLAQAVGTHL